MAKRTATTELNHDNWEKEEEAEDAGTFRKVFRKILKWSVGAIK